MEPKTIKKPSKNQCGKKMIFKSIFIVFLGSLRVPNLPSVRKVNCRKTNKRKKNRRKRNSAGKETLLSNPNTPLGLQSRPGADLSCLRQLSAPGLQKIDVCENLELCKGRVPSISLQVLCGSGCVKSRKFGEKLRKTLFFIRFSLKISERDQK